jgi:type IV pilus assembly protein PilA
VVIGLRNTSTWAARLGAADGFTLLELLVVIVIGGILAAISLPSLLNQVNKAKQVEAKTNLASLNRAQQAYYLENSSFADSMENLGVGISPSTVNYSYSVVSPDQAVSAIQRADSRSISLKAFAGRTALVAEGGQDSRLETILCETEKSKLGRAPDPKHSRADGLSCASGTDKVGQ